MAQALWNGVVVAESDDTVVVEGNHYFPRESLVADYFEPSDHTSVCAWKGRARYLTLRVGDEVNPGAAWYYPEPSPAAQQIKDRIAFWHGVQVTA